MGDENSTPLALGSGQTADFRAEKRRRRYLIFGSRSYPEDWPHSSGRPSAAITGCSNKPIFRSRSERSLPLADSEAGCAFTL